MKFSSSIVSSIFVASSIIGTEASSLRPHHHHDHRLTTQDLHHHHHHRHDSTSHHGHDHDHDHDHDRHLFPVDYLDGEEGEEPICADPKSSDEVAMQWEGVIDAWSTRQLEEHRKLGEEGPPPLTRIDLAPWKEIDVVFHILTGADLDYGTNPTTPDQIEEQMEILNQAFVPGKFRFNLLNVTYTANNIFYKPRISINTYFSQWFQFLYDRGSVLRQGDFSTLNIYVGRPRCGGFGTYPWQTIDPMNNPLEDGISLNERVVPHGSGYGYPDGYYNTGLILAHEVGHWLGLFHTFDGGCDGHDGHGDFVFDTNPEAEPGYGCPIGRSTCPAEADDEEGDSSSSKSSKSSSDEGGLQIDNGPDPVQNYMDYSFDFCKTHFTAGQYDRMHKFWHAVRVPLANGENIAFDVTPETPIYEGNYTSN